MAVVTREEVRQKVTLKMEALKASFTDFPAVIQYDNKATVDLTRQQKPYVDFQIVYQDGDQVGLGNNTPTRIIGTIVVAVRGRAGTGTVDMNKLVDHFFRPLGMTDSMLPVRTYAARFSSSPNTNGWVSQAILIPFWYDTE